MSPKHDWDTVLGVVEYPGSGHSDPSKSLSPNEESQGKTSSRCSAEVAEDAVL